MSDDELDHRCHDNCIEYARENARRSLAGGERAERNGILTFATASDFPVFANGAFRLDSAVPAADVVEVADAWSGERSRGWTVGTTSWAGQDEDLIAAASGRRITPSSSDRRSSRG